jgi:hemolysin activation/secretion protein
LLQDAFEERRNQDQIERTEDFYAGTYARARLGYASTVWGSDRDSILFTLKAGTTIEHGDEHKYSLLIESKGGARFEHGKLANALYGAESRYYWRVSNSQLFFASLSGTLTKNLDPDQQILLGGDNGLRGYPLRYQDGSARALLTLEQRIYTKYYLFRLFHVGGAVFFDMGRTWGRGTVAGPSEGLLKDVGVGLRFGSSRSAFGNVIHVDLAFPLDGDKSIDKLQLVVETKKSF